MARLLNATLDAVTGPVAQRRRPDYSIEIFDIRSTSGEIVPTRINDVVLHNFNGAGLPVIVGPKDFTDDCIAIDITEVAGDYADNGVASTQIQIQVVDPDGSLDPLGNPAPADGRWLRQGNVIVVREGDVDVPVDEWPITFTGAIQGQPGQDFNRTTGNAVLTAKANSREVDFLRRLSTSRNFEQGESFFDIANEIATTDMGLDADEVNFPTFGSRVTQFRTTQFVMESPLVTIAKIMFPDGFMPKFEGDGRLGLTTGAITKGPTRIYEDSELQVRLTRPIVEENGPNEVEVIGLDPNLEQVIQQRQELASASITTGFFSGDAKLPVFWSGDKTQQALDARMEVDASIGDSIFSFGTESFTDFPLGDGGSVEGRIDVDGAQALQIIFAAILAGAWLAESFFPDAVRVFVTANVGIGVTIPVGRPIHAITGALLMGILAHQGRGQYRITGRPYEYVFKEIRCVARITGIRSEDIQSITIENHLINSEADCDASAERVLRRERAKQNVRQMEMLHDLRLEPDDVFELGTGTAARKYMIRSIRRRLSRAGTGLASYDSFEVTTGVRP